jgi:hypothetical protein
MMMSIATEGGIEQLPDGTIIRWLRIPGDLTSEAVAFVRVQIETRSVPTAPSFGEHTTRTVWISPGGWEPMTVAEAGINYPCQILRWGDGLADGEWISVPHEFATTAEPEMLLPPHGGTWAREAALKAAISWCTNETTNEMLAIAEHFETWLDSTPPDGPIEVEPWPSSADLVGQMADDLGHIAVPDRSNIWKAQELLKRGWRR